MDGASQSIMKRAGMGCVAMDHDGVWLGGGGGEAWNVGQADPLTTELLAIFFCLKIFFGLEFIWRSNYRNIVL